MATWPNRDPYVRRVPPPPIILPPGPKPQAPGGHVPEHLTHEGASRLAARLEAYWEGRATFRIEPLTHGKGYQNEILYVVRSDMVNGNPAR